MQEQSREAAILQKNQANVPPCWWHVSFLRKKKGGWWLLSKITDGRLQLSAGRTASDRSCLKIGRCHHWNYGCSSWKTSVPPPAHPVALRKLWSPSPLHTYMGTPWSPRLGFLTEMRWEPWKMRAGGMDLVAGRGSPVPNCCWMRTHLRPCGSHRITRGAKEAPQNHRQGLG